MDNIKADGLNAIHPRTHVPKRLNKMKSKWCRDK